MWREGAATWIEAEPGSPWLSPGAEVDADEGPADRSTTPVGAAEATEAARWVSLDVREAVTYWLAHPDENHGLLITGAGGSGELEFASAQWEEPTQRPKLVIVFEPAPAARLSLTQWLGPLHWMGLGLGPAALLLLVSQGVHLARMRQESKRRVH